MTMRALVCRLPWTAVLFVAFAAFAAVAGPPARSRPAPAAANAASGAGTQASRGGVPAAPSTAALPAPALSPAELAKAEQEHFEDVYRSVIAYHVLLSGERASRALVEAAVYDVGQKVDELEGRYAVDELFVKDKGVLDGLREILAKAHFQCAMLNARGVDLERSTSEYEKAAALIGFDPADWQIPIERTARLGVLPAANDMAYETAPPRRLVEDLKTFWSAGVIARVLVQQLSVGQRAGIKFERVGGPRDGFSEALFALAETRFAERMAAGSDEIRLALPPGHYRLSSSSSALAPVEFALVAEGIPDPVVLNPNTFSFEFASPEGSACRPQLTINGIPVRSLQGLPYGTYRVEAPRACKQRLPDKVVVEQRAEVTVRTEPERMDYLRAGEPVFLFVTTPPGSTFKLRM
jgi:hypothetical protein